MLQPPKSIGPYRILRRLGAGGMGIVYLAERDGQEVALKTLGALPEPALRERFEREAQVRVKHPNVVAILDAGIWQDIAFIVLERLEGETLRERFTRGPLAPGALAEFGAQAAEGLAAAHAAGIVHRDIKPSNIFLCDDGPLKVIDFGVALTMNSSTRLTAPGAVPGTVGYVPPEVAGGDDATAQSDIWSLGAVLYEGLVGSPPFLRATPLATAVATLMHEMPLVRHKAPAAPDALCSVVERALSREPGRRFATATEFANALRSLEGAASAMPEPPAFRPGERRLVAVVLAEALVDAPAARAAIVVARGSVLALAGDRMLGIFGAGRTHGDELERAAEVSLELRQFAGRVALSSGWASGDGGSVQGAVVEAVERANATAMDGVALDAATAEALSSAFVVHERGADLFSLSTRAGDEATPSADVTEVIGAAALVGREVEVAQLAAALRTADNDGRTVLLQVVGPPGIGKTRLLGELERLARAAGRHVLRAGCSTLLERSELGWLRALALENAPADVRGRLTKQGPGDLGSQRDRVRLALLDWLAAAARDSVLLVDDAHFSDPVSLALLDDLLDEVSDESFVLAIASRGSAPLPDHEHVRVEPRGLDRAAVAALAFETTREVLSEEHLAELAARTGGNPLFVVECSLARGVRPEEALPLTVEAAVQCRLDALPTVDREVCLLAAVFGRPFTAAELASLRAGSGPSLRSLVGQSLLLRRGRRELARYEFRSRITAEVAYRSSTEERLEDVHRRVAQSAREATERARHFELAGDLEAAAAAQGDVALEAAGRGDCSLALHAARAALSLGAAEARHYALHMVQADAMRFLGQKAEHGRALEACIRTASTSEERARALSEHCVWLWRGGDVDEATRVAERAIDEAVSGGSAEAKVLAYGRHYLVRSHEGDAVESLERARALRDEVSLPLQASILAWTAHHYATTGALGQQLSAYVELVELYDTMGDLRRKAGAETNLADAYNRVGAYAEAAEALESAIQACARVRNRMSEGYAQLNLGFARIAMGRPQAGLEALDVAQELAEQHSETRLLALARLYRAPALPPREALSETEALLAEPTEGMNDLKVGAAASAALAALELGELPRADRHSSNALAWLRALGGVEEGEMRVYQARVGVLRAQGHGDAAEALVTEFDERLKERSLGIDDPELRARFTAAHTPL